MVRYYSQKEINEKNKEVDKRKSYLAVFLMGVLFSGIMILSYIGLLCLLYFIEMTGRGF